jgi:hypothetical protein
MIHNTEQNAEHFIQKSIGKYGEIFDFSEMIYVNNYNKVTISCKLHNEKICVKPRDHYENKFGGCKQCEKEGKKKTITLEDGEITKDVNIEKYRDIYIISNHGRCFNKVYGNLMSPCKSSGYYRVGLSYLSEVETFAIHYLVYISFKDDYEEGKVIDHINREKLDNHIDNLRCVTQSENMKNAGVQLETKNPIQIFRTNGEFVKEVHTRKEAMKTTNIKTPQMVAECLKGTRISSKGYTFKYKNDITPNIVVTVIDDSYKCIGILNEKDFSKYYINITGNVINKVTGKLLARSKHYVGYETVYLKDTDGLTKNTSLHRLLAKFFLKDGETNYYDKKLVVNHINKKKDDNRIENLEWVTYSENTAHSLGKKVAKFDPKTNGVVQYYDSITLACLDNEISEKTLSNACKSDEMKIVCGYYWMFVEVDDLSI